MKPPNSPSEVLRLYATNRLEETTDLEQQLANTERLAEDLKVRIARNKTECVELIATADRLDDNVAFDRTAEQTRQP